MKREKLEVGA
ncbi:hypothetical protein CGLO_00079 [Colletotrichum gloeosporioides Cg-14]|uniref:Uncharacterized protein n=1 Tax=Colletotrichum gloeosporioides (strain Cg-14) TaxID=1237896 RepID=T0L488_COLGC|nr:hypothetical protein CGLO_00079 [Colletotrichum gloeosporioides Cg-14]